jgi:ABC-type multidrug transport system permease subunit
MNDWIVTYKAVAWKEVKENLRQARWLVPLTIGCILFVQYRSTKPIYENDALSPIMKNHMLSCSATFMPLMVIMFVGNAFVIRSMYEERLNAMVHVLLAAGVSPLCIWVAKMSIAVVVAYLTALITIALNIVFMKVVFDGAGRWGWVVWAGILVNMPVMAIGIVSLMSVMFWWFRNKQLAALLGIVVMSISLSLWPLADYMKTAKQSCFVLSGTLVAGAAMIGISVLGIRVISNERITTI